MRVLITGAAGRVGRAAIEALEADHDLILVDRRKIPGRHVILSDVARGRSPRLPGTWIPGGHRWQRSLAGTDVVLHLAAEARPGAHWKRHFRDGLIASRTVMHAAAEAGVPRVVLASSHRVVRASLSGAAADHFDAGEDLANSDTSPRPWTDYGIAKAAAELTGRMLVDRGKLDSAVAIRIGTFAEDRPDKLPDRYRWVPPSDLATIFRHTVEAPFSGFHVIYGVKLDADRDIDMSYTRRFLGMDARDERETRTRERQLV